MPEDTSALEFRTPWHLWAVGILGLLWNALGAFDYLMTETRNAGYMGQFSPEQLDFFYGLPAWAVAFWAIAVWGGLLGAILLLMRKRLAVPVLLISLVSMVVTAIRNYVFASGMEVTGGSGLAFTVVIFVVAVALWLYGRRMARTGVLV